MLLKPVTPTEDLLRDLDAVQRHCVTQDQIDRFNKTRAQIIKGSQTEHFTANVLNRYFANEIRHILLHDLRIPDGFGGFAQIDHVLIFESSRTISLFESKHFSGRLTKNDHNEWTVWYGRKAVNIPSPVEQIKRSRETIRSYLKLLKIDGYVKAVNIFVLVDPSTTIDRKAISDNTPIYKADNFYEHWLQQAGTTALGRLFSGTLAEGDGLRIGKEFLRRHVDASYDWVTRLKLSPAPDDVQLDEPVEPNREKEDDLAPVQPEGEAGGSERLNTNFTEVQTDLSETASSSVIDHSAEIDFNDFVLERILPDGNIALRLNRDASAEHRELLAVSCKGAIWKPRFQNWIVSPDRLPFVRDEFLRGLRCGSVHEATDPDEAVDGSIAGLV